LAATVVVVAPAAVEVAPGAVLVVDARLAVVAGRRARDVATGAALTAVVEVAFGSAVVTGTVMTVVVLPPMGGSRPTTVCRGLLLVVVTGAADVAPLSLLFSYEHPPSTASSVQTPTTAVRD
jgi:hypothetical protein